MLTHLFIHFHFKFRVLERIPGDRYVNQRFEEKKNKRLQNIKMSFPTDIRPKDSKRSKNSIYVHIMLKVILVQF